MTDNPFNWTNSEEPLIEEPPSDEDEDEDLDEDTPSPSLLSNPSESSVRLFEEQLLCCEECETSESGSIQNGNSGDRSAQGNV